MKMSSKIKFNLINGILFPRFISHQDERAGFCVLPSDLIVVSYPKSGSTWTQQIVKLIKLGGNDDTKHIWDAVPFLEIHLMGKGQSLPSPRAFKTHLPYHMMPGGEPAKSVAKYIYVARNPKDVAVSFYYHFCNLKEYEFDGDWNCFFELFMKGEVEYGLWFDHVLEWWKHKGQLLIYSLFMKIP